jgi:hypothetical protein
MQKVEDRACQQGMYARKGGLGKGSESESYTTRSLSGSSEGDLGYFVVHGKKPRRQKLTWADSSSHMTGRQSTAGMMVPRHRSRTVSSLKSEASYEIVMPLPPLGARRAVFVSFAQKKERKKEDPPKKARK